MNTRIAITVLVLAAVILAGCASTPETSQPVEQARETVAPQDYADRLYEGEPDVVFATEFPIASIEDALVRGEAALASGEMDLALYLFVRAYDLDSESLHALQRIAEIHRSRGRQELAVRALTRALQVDSTNPVALQTLGLIYLQARRYDEAQELLERTVAEAPGLWRAHNGLGVLADMRDDHDAAIAAYDRALAVNPGEASLLNNRGYSLYLAGDYESAASDFALAASQGIERAWLNLGLVRARQGDYEEAVQTMSRTVTPEVAYNDVGYIAMRQGDETVAALYFEKAIRLAPRYFEAAEKNLADLTQPDTLADPVALNREVVFPGVGIDSIVVVGDE